MTDIWEGFELEQVYGLLPNPCPNHEAVVVIQVYLTALVQNNINLVEVPIIHIHHIFKEIIINSKSKSINGHLIFLLDVELSCKFQYDQIFPMESDADYFYRINSIDIESMLLDKKISLSMEKLHWKYNMEIDVLDDFIDKSYGYERNDYLVFTWIIFGGVTLKSKNNINEDIDVNDVKFDLILEWSLKYKLLNKIIIDTYYNSDIYMKKKIHSKIVSKFLSKERVFRMTDIILSILGRCRDIVVHEFMKIEEQLLFIENFKKLKLENDVIGKLDYRLNLKYSNIIYMKNVSCKKRPLRAAEYYYVFGQRKDQIIDDNIVRTRKPYNINEICSFIKEHAKNQVGVAGFSNYYTKVDIKNVESFMMISDNYIDFSLNKLGICLIDSTHFDDFYVDVYETVDIESMWFKYESLLYEKTGISIECYNNLTLTHTYKHIKYGENWKSLTHTVVPMNHFTTKSCKSAYLLFREKNPGITKNQQFNFKRILDSGNVWDFVVVKKVDYSCNKVLDMDGFFSPQISKNIDMKNKYQEIYTNIKKINCLNKATSSQSINEAQVDVIDLVTSEDTDHDEVSRNLVVKKKMRKDN